MRIVGVLITISFFCSAIIWLGLEEDTKDNVVNESREGREFVYQPSEKVIKPRERQREVSKIVRSEQSYSIAGNNYSPTDDCASHITLELYNYIDSDVEGREWLKQRGYTLFYSGNNLQGYRSLSSNDLEVLSEGNDALAMWQLIDNMGWKKESEAKKLLEEMLVKTGNFTAINKIISFDVYDEKPRVKPLVKYYDEWLTWVALNKKLNGLVFFGFGNYYDLIEDKHRQLAKDKLISINQQRYYLGLDKLPTEPLPNHLRENMENYFSFVREQKNKGIDSLENCKIDTHFIEEIKRVSSEGF